MHVIESVDSTAAESASEGIREVEATGAVSSKKLADDA